MKSTVLVGTCKKQGSSVMESQTVAIVATRMAAIFARTTNGCVLSLLRMLQASLSVCLNRIGVMWT